MNASRQSSPLAWMRDVRGPVRALAAAAMAFGLNAVSCGPAVAWGDEGHEIIALIAQAYLDPFARKAVSALLAADTDTLTTHDMAAAATWPDKLRRLADERQKTGQWHFVDIEISIALRQEMRAMGRLGEDKRTIRVAAADGSGMQPLPLAEGDKVRLLNRVFGADKAHFGSNGDTVTVLGVTNDGIQTRNTEGQVAYGYAATIDASQGATSDEHIDALPEGSRAVNGLKSYVAESRHRDTTWMVVNEAAERRQIASRIPIGEHRLIRDDDIWRNVAANLSRQPIKVSRPAPLRC